MNAIINAITDIKFRIPSEILNITFRENMDNINPIIPIDDRILNLVIRPRVLKDLNLVGGIELRIDVSQCPIRQVNSPFNEFIVEVGKNLTNGKSIISVLSLIARSTSSGSGGIGYGAPSQVDSAMTKMYNNLANVNVVQTSRLELIGENTVLIQDPALMLSYSVLRCVIENNSNLENINPRNYPAISNFVLLAVKSYIYNKMVIKLDQGYVYSGHELGIVSEIINGYADAEDMYQELLTGKMRKISFMNNNDSKGRFIKAMIGNNI
jgi:hypothetical protein